MVEGEILTITTFTVNGVVKVSITTNSSGNRRNGADALLYFELPEDILKGMLVKWNIRNSTVPKMMYDSACINISVHGQQLVSYHLGYT